MPSSYGGRTPPARNTPLPHWQPAPIVAWPLVNREQRRAKGEALTARFWEAMMSCPTRDHRKLDGFPYKTPPVHRKTSQQLLAAEDFTCNYLWNDDFARKTWANSLIPRIRGEGEGVLEPFPIPVLEPGQHEVRRFGQLAPSQIDLRTRLHYGVIFSKCPGLSC